MTRGRESAPLTAHDLTVVIPARDAAATIEDAINSISAQHTGMSSHDTPSAHIIVVDDGSEDATAAVASVAGAVVLTETGVGPGAARNSGISAAGTELIAFCDADDQWEPGRPALDLEAFNADDELELLIGRSRFIAEDPSLLAGHHFDGEHNSDANSVVIPHFGAAMMRRRVFEQCGPIDSVLQNYEDYEFFYRARDLGVVMRTVDRIVQTRFLHAGSTSHQNPPEPGDLLAIIQRSILRRRAATDRAKSDGQDRHGGDQRGE